MTALEYLDSEWSSVDPRLPDWERRAAWARIVEAANRQFGHAETSQAIVAHVRRKQLKEHASWLSRPIDTLLSALHAAERSQI